MYEEVSEKDLKIILQDSIITHSGIPVYITNVAKKTLFIFDIINNKEFSEDVSSSKLDFTPVKLGMCNYNQQVCYLSRIPKRQYSQGLTSNTLNAAGLTRDTILPDFTSRSVFDCIMGVYPKYEKALNILCTIDSYKKPKSLAFSREFAIDEGFQIFYKTTPVGILNECSGFPTFMRNKKYLQEIFEEKTHG